MIKPGKLVGMVLRRHERSVTERRRSPVHGREEIISGVADKGHFVVYSIDGGRFVVPLEFLESPLCRQLLRMSEDEFGLRSNSPIVLPCEAVFIDYILSLFQRKMAGDMEKALLVSIMSASHCSTSSVLPEENIVYHQISLHGL